MSKVVTYAPGDLQCARPVRHRLRCLGQKTGAGYYRYEGRNPVPDPEVMAITRRARPQATQEY